MSSYTMFNPCSPCCDVAVDLCSEGFAERWSVLYLDEWIIGDPDEPQYCSTLSLAAGVRSGGDEIMDNDALIHPSSQCYQVTVNPTDKTVRVEGSRDSLSGPVSWWVLWRAHSGTWGPGDTSANLYFDSSSETVYKDISSPEEATEDDFISVSLSCPQETLCVENPLRLFMTIESDCPALDGQVIEMAYGIWPGLVNGWAGLLHLSGSGSSPQVFLLGWMEVHSLVGYQPQLQVWFSWHPDGLTPPLPSCTYYLYVALFGVNTPCAPTLATSEVAPDSCSPFSLEAGPYSAEDFRWDLVHTNLRLTT